MIRTSSAGSLGVADARALDAADLAEGDAVMNAPPTSLAASRSPRETAAFLVAVAAVGGLCCWGQGSTGTWVRLAVAVGDHEALTADIFQLSTWSTLRNFWNAGAHATALVTGACTGGLPYAQLLAYLYVWFRPLDAAARGALCGALVQTVRAQHMLTFAAILLCVALYIDAPNPATGLDVEVEVVFGFGVLGFELANLGSYALAAALARAHAAGAPAKPPGEAPLLGNDFDGDDARRMASAFETPRALAFDGTASISNACTASTRAQRAALAAGRALIVANVALVWLALTRPALRFTTRGLASKFMDRTRSRVGVVDVAKKIDGATRGLRSKRLWTAWTLTVCVLLDVAADLALALVFFAPLPPVVRRRLFSATLHLHALASADVLWVVLANFAQNITVISAWIIDLNAERLCAAVERLTRFAGCMEETGAVLPGFWVLGCYAVVHNAAFLFVMALAYRGSLPPWVRRRLPRLAAGPVQ